MSVKGELLAWIQAFRELNDEDRAKRRSNPAMWWIVFGIGVLLGVALIFGR